MQTLFPDRMQFNEHSNLVHCVGVGCSLENIIRKL